MNDIKDIVTKPIFFERNRVYRIYHGGKPFKSLFDDGYDDGTDNMFPEEWVASKVRAINPKYFGARDGVSKVKGTGVFFDDLLKEHSAELLGPRKYDCLVKFLDSATRLPFQVHPTKEFSKNTLIPNTAKPKRGLSSRLVPAQNFISALRTKSRKKS